MDIKKLVVTTYEIKLDEEEMKTFRDTIAEKINNGSANDTHRQMYQQIQGNI